MRLQRQVSRKQASLLYVYLQYLERLSIYPHGQINLPQVAGIARLAFEHNRNPTEMPYFSNIAKFRRVFKLLVEVEPRDLCEY